MAATRQEHEKQHRDDIHKIKMLQEEVYRLKATVAALEVECKLLNMAYEHIRTEDNYDTTLEDAYTSRASGFSSVHGSKYGLKLNKAVLKQIKRRRDEGLSQREIAKMFKLSLGTVNKACKIIQDRRDLHETKTPYF